MDSDKNLPTSRFVGDIEIQFDKHTILLKNARDLGNGLVSGTSPANGPDGIELHVTVIAPSGSWRVVRGVLS